MQSFVMIPCLDLQIIMFDHVPNSMVFLKNFSRSCKVGS
jgi:hypothetical protein